MPEDLSARRPVLGWLAAGLIAASAAVGLFAMAGRLLDGAPGALQVAEGVTLFLAAAAYLVYALAHHRNRRELLTRSILVSAFALWGVVQIAPGFAPASLLNDITMVLFVVDLAILLSPWS